MNAIPAKALVRDQADWRCGCGHLNPDCDSVCNVRINYTPQEKKKKKENEFPRNLFRNSTQGSRVLSV